jgi:Flp pilus assembly protein TadD
MKTLREDELRDAARWDAVDEATELLHEERYHEAMGELHRALQADPKNAYAYHFLGVAFFELGEIAAARDAYSACLKVAPEHLGARVALCHVLRILGDLRGALREGTSALSQSPGDADALHAVGLVYHALGDRIAARKYLEAFLAAGAEFEVSLEVRALLESMSALESGDH